MMILRRIKHALQWVRLLFHALRKSAAGFFDAFQPSGRVEAILRYAHGPKAGKVYKRFAGQNVVTSYLNGAARPSGGTYDEYSGRDLMRRILIKRLSDGGFAGGLGGDSTSTLHQMSLGSGSTAELSSDDELDTAIVGSDKDISSVEFDGTNPYVTVVCVWDETEVNQSISEVGLWSENEDFCARKTFNAFTKTSDFTLEIRWTIKF